MTLTAQPDPAGELADLICRSLKGDTDHQSLLTLADRFLTAVEDIMPQDIMYACRALGNAAFAHAFCDTETTLLELHNAVRSFAMLNFLRPKP